MKATNCFAAFILIGSLFMIGSCKKKSVDLHFDMQVASVNFTVDTTSAMGDVSFSSTNFNSNLQQTLDANSVNSKDIESIKLTGATFTIVNTTGPARNFNVIDKIYSNLSATGLAETRIAYLDTVPKGVSSITLNTDATDVKDYLKQTTTTFRAGGHTNAPVAIQDSVHAVLTFRITAAGQL